MARETSAFELAFAGLSRLGGSLSVGRDGPAAYVARLSLDGSYRVGRGATPQDAVLALARSLGFMA